MSEFNLPDGCTLDDVEGGSDLELCACGRVVAPGSDECARCQSQDDVDD